MTNDNHKQVRDAINLLAKHGMRYRSIPAGCLNDYARGIGIAIAPYFTGDAILHLAAEALEDINEHGKAALIRGMIK